jgi:hypothetical protein
MGMTLRELAPYRPVAGTRSAGTYTLSRAPNAQPEFVQYAVVLSPRLGVCKVVAVTRAVQTSEFGDELRRAFARLEELLAGKYGEGFRRDELKEGSTWTEPRDWMASLRERDRTYLTIWAPQVGADLPSNLNGLVLKANSSSAPGSGFVSLTYEFSNWDECRRDLNLQRSDAF